MVAVASRAPDCDEKPPGTRTETCCREPELPCTHGAAVLASHITLTLQLATSTEKLVPSSGSANVAVSCRTAAGQEYGCHYNTLHSPRFLSCRCKGNRRPPAQRSPYLRGREVRSRPPAPRKRGSARPPTAAQAAEESAQALNDPSLPRHGAQVTGGRHLAQARGAGWNEGEANYTAQACADQRLHHKCTGVERYCAGPVDVVGCRERWRGRRQRWWAAVGWRSHEPGRIEHLLTATRHSK